MKKPFTLSFFLILLFASLSVTFFSIDYPEASQGKIISINSFVVSKTHLGQMFSALAGLSTLLIICLAIFSKSKTTILVAYIVLGIAISGTMLHKANEKGEARLEEIEVGNVLRSDSLSSPNYLTVPKTQTSQRQIQEMARFESIDEANQARTELVRFIWKQDALPLDEMPNEILENIDLAGSDSFTNLLRVDAIKVSMEHGFHSTVYQFVPKNDNNRLFIYHQGHHPGGFLAGGMDTIRKLVNEGYSVLAFSMLGTAENTLPEKISTKRGTWERLETQSAAQHHDSLHTLEGTDFSPLKLFFHPVTVAINYALTQKEYHRVSMVGISGGGWTTTVYAALDDRVDFSYPVAGSLPEYLALAPPNGSLGDYEQNHPILRNLGYLKLYVLAAVGLDRHQRQILNQFDECCFRGIGAYSYVKSIDESIDELGLGGSYTLSIIPQTKHNISDVAFKLILHDEDMLEQSQSLQSNAVRKPND
ncbi:hypothetical protein [Thalassospira australica]|uniref:hypothetical protein n=1 Tax=Thalassospira australica TaxID=1528106 RepID=UPI00051A25C5|nr:hypothetical protein [Thalassospira australica]